MNGVILLELEKKVSVHGVVKDRQVKPLMAKPPMVRADLVRDEGSPVPVVWWEEMDAPPEGSRVSVSGTVLESFGELYISVEDTRWLRPHPKGLAPGTHPYHRLLRYLYECVEAESGLETILDPKDDRMLTLQEGRDPAVTRNADTDKPVYLTLESHRRWFEIQRDAGRESVLLGYPVIVGTRVEKGVPQTRLAPLFVVECEWEADERGVRLSRKDPANEDLAPGALELLGLDLEERERLAEVIDGSSQVAEGTSPRDRLQLRLNLLQAQGLLEAVPAIDPENLSGVGQAVSVSNSIVVLPLDRPPYVRALLLDLARLADMAPELLERGPLGALLQDKQVRTAFDTTPEPTVLPANYAQDVAVSASRQAALSVVTGPPGTGKSQMIVNAVAAAVCAGETVLVASKNNQAVDVVNRRFRELKLELPVIRTGNHQYKMEAISKIIEVLGRKVPEDIGLGPARVTWDAARLPVNKAHRSFADRHRLSARIRQLDEKLAKAVRALPADVFTSCSALDLQALNEALVRSFEKPPWFLRLVPPLARRWRGARIGEAHRALFDSIPASARASLGLDDIGSLPWGSSDERLRTARKALEKVRALLDEVREGKRLQDQIAADEADLKAMPSVDSLERQMAHADGKRGEAGVGLVNAVWRHRFVNAHALSKKAAWLLVQLAALISGKPKEATLAGLAPRLLDFLPAWLVSSLSVRRTFPLEPGLFDLVIVDEASQGDVASLVPLLFRAKRAMIVGDAQQPTHVTRLSPHRAQRLAGETGLTDAQRDQWNYVTANAFSLSDSHVAGSSTTLDQHFRSHPAIIELCNRELYGSKLVVCTDPAGWADRVGLEWVEVSGEVKGTSSGSRYNAAEVEKVAREVAHLRSDFGGSLRTFGVVSPYRAQTDLIRDHLKRLLPGGGAVTVGTAHSFQGDERDVMVYSPVLSGLAAGKKGLLAARPQLINVAISRAAKLLVVVGDRQACLSSSSSLLEGLARYSVDLERNRAHSPFEIRLAETLSEKGVSVAIGEMIAGHRVGLLVQSGGSHLVVECNGHPFEDASPLPEKDAALGAAGARFLRFSPRRLRRDLEGCVSEVLSRLAGAG